MLYFFIYAQTNYEWWLLITSHHPVNFSSNRPHGSKDITKFICHVNSRNHVIEGNVALWLDMWLLIISHPSVKFDSDRSRESEFKTFFICHVTLCDHVINRLCDLMDNNPALEPTTVKFGSHRSRGSWDITFFICHVITWSRDQSVKRTQWMVDLYYEPSPCQVWQSWVLWKWRYIYFY